jgi:hypothetical protein
MKGNYLITESGYISESMNALTGIPVFEYKNKEINETFWSVVNAADKANYIMQASTVGTGLDTTKNKCNIPNGHAYSLISAFELKAINGSIIQAVMIRNPHG